MDSRDLTPDQCRAIADRLADQIRYLGALQKRMEQRGFPAADPLLVAVRKAHDELHGLRMRFHYAGCKGVGRRGNEKKS